MELKKDLVKNYALNTLKIDTIGFTTPDIPQEDLINYRQYLKNKNYNDMLWLYTRQTLRENPKLLLPETQSIIVLGFNYFNNNNKHNKDYKISNYANQKRDYHIWIKEVTNKLVLYLDNFNYISKAFVDSAPILEKVFAKQTNIGWQGKHTCIVSTKFGSWLFLSVILTSAKFEPDTPHKDYCGKCTKCITACPTGALTPYKLDVKKCLSYLTIEHKKQFPNDIISKLDNKIFGCDECISSCYFNKYQKPSSHEDTNNNTNFPQSAVEFLLLEQSMFNTLFKNTPLKRTGYKILLRNCLLIFINKTIFIPFHYKQKVLHKLISLLNHEDQEINTLSNSVIKKYYDEVLY